MKNLILILLLHLFAFSALAENIISCSHIQLCKMIDLLARDNKMTNLKTEVLVNISGDPHEYEPTAFEIKKLINVPILLFGPRELNPWIQKIIYQRSKQSTAKSIDLAFTPVDFNFYPKASAEAISHFWLYPKIYCSLQLKLETELSKLFPSLKNSHRCDFLTPENELQMALQKNNLPIILTHDALLPLMHSLAPNKKESITAIKGSGHHEEVGPQAIKKMYDALKAPQVIWIIEAGINVPPIILNKKRPLDKVIYLDTSNSKNDNPFSVIKELSVKLNQISEK
jgi:ABC-type Zn uptake system ZnuABC Zn-binding protein ZnuA